MSTGTYVQIKINFKTQAPLILHTHLRVIYLSKKATAIPVIILTYTDSKLLYMITKLSEQKSKRFYKFRFARSLSATNAR